MDVLDTADTKRAFLLYMYWAKESACCILKGPVLATPTAVVVQGSNHKITKDDGRHIAGESATWKLQRMVYCETLRLGLSMVSGAIIWQSTLLCAAVRLTRVCIRGDEELDGEGNLLAVSNWPHTRKFSRQMMRTRCFNRSPLTLVTVCSYQPPCELTSDKE